MSLDVYLYGAEEESVCTCPCCGNEHTVTVKEELFTANITHNLGEMAQAAGIYKHLWRPDEVGIERADQLVLPLRDALQLLRENPAKFQVYNPKNGWGTYDGLVGFTAAYLRACQTYPTARIEVSR